MSAELIALLVRLNFAAGAAIVLVLLARRPARRRFGPRQAYALWLTVPLAMLGALLPTGESSGPAGLLESAAVQAGAWLSRDDHARTLAAVWAAGVVVSIAIAAVRYARFLARARAGKAGPAIVGVFAPRLVVPADFADRFTAEERRLVRAHERAHMDRLDARWNALVLALQCLSWFNPLAHLGARAMRFDQELACDATVMARLPTERRRYAETLLRTHEPAIVSPLGCGWTGPAAQPLAVRLTALLQPRPAEQRSELGTMLLAGLWIAALTSTWAAQPRHRQPPEPEHLILLEMNPPSEYSAHIW